ncbi:MAG: ClpX C4-type zinc finger protein, partial [Ignavibacteriaceae bacterium]
MSKKQGQRIVKCSFCGRDGNEVGSMIAGPDVYICDICIASSVDILKNNLAAYNNSKKGKWTLHSPQSIKKSLDEFVIGQ